MSKPARRRGKARRGGGEDYEAQGPVLVATDFSDDSRAAVVWAGRQAERTGCPLTILHVVHDPAASPGFYRRPDDDWLRPMADVAREMMDEFLAEMREAHPALTTLAAAQDRLVTGLPAGRIVEVAAEIEASLIVVGSRGRSNLPHLLLGSVAERVVQLAPMPVVVIKQS